MSTTLTFIGIWKSGDLRLVMARVAPAGRLAPDGGLKNQIKKLNKGIEGGRFSGETLDKAKDLRSNLQKQADNIQSALDRAKNKAKQ